MSQNPDNEEETSTAINVNMNMAGKVTVKGNVATAQNQHNQQQLCQAAPLQKIEMAGAPDTGYQNLANINRGLAFGNNA